MNTAPARVVATLVLLAPLLQAFTAESLFVANLRDGGIVSLKPGYGATNTEYIATGRRLGDVSLRYRQQDGQWISADTTSLTNSDTTGRGASYTITRSGAPALSIDSRFDIREADVLWTVQVRNLSEQPVELGDLSLPLPISRGGGGQRGGGGGAQRGPASPVILKHSFLSGHGSFLFWMRADSAPPFLAMVPVEDARFEYWETSGGQGGGARGYNAFIHSKAAGAAAKERGTNWRQPHTSVTLAPAGRRSDSKSYSFKLRWADDYEHVRQILVEEGGIDTHVVPGMTVPSDLSAQFALRTKQRIRSVDAEFPDKTEVKSLGRRGDYQLYQARFSKLGENRLTVRYGDDREMYLEFFATEPLETLINKRGAFIASHQVRDTNKWYNGLLGDWNMRTGVQPTPDNYDEIRGFRIYAVTCDDPGLSKPAYLASKLAKFPVQSEVEALDRYITHFVWGGLQQTTEEPYPYGVYGIPDWKQNRDSADTGRNGQRHLWRVYDYPHIITMYLGMYQVAKYHPHIKTELPANEYLQRSFGTARAMFTVPMEIERWSAYRTGFYNELVIVDLIRELQAAGMTAEADTLTEFWDRKVKTFVNGRVDLFRSEYAFDSTGFESTHALAKWAMAHADKPGETNSGIPLENARRFLENQMSANLFCRGWIEPAYYYLGSDYRGGAGNGYVLTYMSQMGGWGVLDYGLNFAAKPDPYLRLGYASYLSAWALMNTGTPESNYGYWYPGKDNDGGAGGGFEPAPFGRTWLGMPHTRGSWYYSCEIDLGYCGALRTAATVLSDDPIFGRFCFGGEWREGRDGIEVSPKDGLRQRFHARLDKNRSLSMSLDFDHFSAKEPIVLKEDLSQLRFVLDADNPGAHTTRLNLSGLAPGNYVVRHGNRIVQRFQATDAKEITVELPAGSTAASQAIQIARTP